MLTKRTSLFLLMGHAIQSWQDSQDSLSAKWGWTWLTHLVYWSIWEVFMLYPGPQQQGKVLVDTITPRRSALLPFCRHTPSRQDSASEVRMRPELPPLPTSWKPGKQAGIQFNARGKGIEAAGCLRPRLELAVGRQCLSVPLASTPLVCLFIFCSISPPLLPPPRLWPYFT